MLEVLSKKTALSKNKCERVFDEFKKLILEVCEKGEEINLRNFGKFSLVEKKARKFLNPQTKRLYFSKPKKVVTFSAYKNFKYAIK